MDQNCKYLAERLLHKGFDDLPGRDQRILRRIAKRVPISENLNERFRDGLSFGEWLADQFAKIGGYWIFILSFAAFLTLWVTLNAYILSKQEIFDPYPLIFLNLILSMLAAIQAPIIMMSHNWQAAKDRLAAANDYEVNLKAELKIITLHEKIDNIRTRQLEALIHQQAEQIDRMDALLGRI